MIKEEDLVSKVKAFFVKRGFKTYKEVRIRARRIDLVSIKDDKLLAIEVKVNNWKRAFQQAIVYRLCADKVYVAIWHPSIENINKSRYEEYGIGILSIKEESIRVVKKPQKVEIVHDYLQERIFKKLEREKNEKNKTLLSFRGNS